MKTVPIEVSDGVLRLPPGIGVAVEAGEKVAKINFPIRKFLLSVHAMNDLSSFLLRAFGIILTFSACFPGHGEDHYVYAGEDLQAAVDAAAAWDTVWVADGVYSTGGRPIFASTVTNRVTIDKPLVLRSVNGPERTFIQGHHDGVADVRCVYLGLHATLMGFTLTNGASHSVVTPFPVANAGGGVLSESTNTLVTNCILTGNWALYGGAAYSGTFVDCLFTNNIGHNGGGAVRGSVLNNCVLVGNSAASGPGGAADTATLNNCTILRNSAGSAGGGTYFCNLNACTLAGNNALGGTGTGGGASRGTLVNCLIVSNNAALVGGGADSANLTNCIVMGNYSYNYGGGVARGRHFNCTIVSNSANIHSGGAYESARLNNCILYYNTAQFSNPNYGSNCTLTNCCTTPQPASGPASFTNAPLFVNLAAADFHLQSNSPCINAGNNSFASSISTDFDGLPRIVRSHVDIGAYEFQSARSSLSYAWAQLFGVPTDGSADTSDPDGDGLNNYQEAICLTDPTNALSVLHLSSVSSVGSNIAVSWRSVHGVPYTLQRSTNFTAVASYQTIASGYPGEDGITTLIHTNGTAAQMNFYRVTVP